MKSLACPVPKAPARGRPTPRGRASALYEAIRTHVQEHFRLPLGREAVAERFRVTPSHVSRLFQRHGAVGFNDYVTCVRIDRAKRLLRFRRRTVGEVAAACGFADVAYFCRVFKQVTGITPGAYRERMPRGG